MFPRVTARRRAVVAVAALVVGVVGCTSSEARLTALGEADEDGADRAVSTSSSPASAATAVVHASFAQAPAADATETAVRIDPPYTDCQRIAAAAGAGHPETSTQVVVRTAGWSDTIATVELAERIGDAWVCSGTMTARVGRSGVRPLLDRRSGDGTTPAGVFPLATMTAPDGQRFSFFGNSPDPGVGAGTYRRVQPGDCFGAVPGTAGYGHLRFDTSCPGPDDEYLPAVTGAYAHAALIGANMEPDVSGDEPGEIPYASAIFLHRFSYVSGESGATKPTSGCVSLALADLTTVLVALRPGTQFVIGPTGWLLDQLDVPTR
jgi:L,D-peptidoglycan transpeptidase YkuD (ErfK/YbiS/YcfS/YnhG family)